MFYKKTINAKKGIEKEFEFDMFATTQDLEQDTTKLKIGQPRKVYNFISEDGTLKSGYGFKPLQMPQSEDDVYNEADFNVEGEVKSLWKLKYYDKIENKNFYYLFYYSDDGIYFDNLFDVRYDPLTYPTTFTSTPYATSYKYKNQDALILSGEGSDMTIITGSGVFAKKNAPRIISCCGHYGKLFAITADKQGVLIYNDNLEISDWNYEKTNNLDFSDGRGDLNKIVSFNDYLYLFRDFGITKVSQYGKDELFEISHIYQSDAYIFPNSIAETGDKIYFLEGNKIKCFNGSSIKILELDCLSLLDGCDNRYAYGQCFEGKYYLACRGNFNDGQKIGCEEKDYKNNILIILDTVTEHIDIMRGYDVNQILALTNKYKSKVVACFYNDYKGYIGEITTDGKFFGKPIKAFWESGKTDFGFSGKIKRVKSFYIKSESDCKITFSSEKQTKQFNIKGKSDVQKIKANVIGNQFVVKIESESENNYISNFVLTVGCG